MKNISKEYLSGSSVLSLSKKYKITENEVRSFLKTQINWYSKSVLDLSLSEQQEILKRYTSQEYSVIELSDEYKISAPSIVKLLTGLGVKRVYHKGRKYDLLKQTPFSKKQKEFITGTLLGDGCIRMSGKLPRLCLVHSKKYEQYFHWKISQLDKYFNIWREQKDKRKNSTLLYTETLQHNGLLEFYKWFYPEKHKIVPDNLDKYMTPYTLAVWFLDDGTLNSGTNHRIYTNSFKYEDQLKLKFLLKRCFDLNCKILTRKDNQHILSFKRKDTVKLSNIIEPYVVPCMKYKLRLSLDRSSTTIRQTTENKIEPIQKPLSWREEWEDFKKSR